MNRAVIVSLVVVALTAGARGQQRVEQPVAVFVDFDEAYSAVAMEQMQRQAERLLKPLGFVLDWRLLEESRGEQTFPYLAVVRFRGTCQGTPISGLDPYPGGDITLTLASSLVSGGSVLPFAEVHCDAVRRFLYWELESLQAWHQQQKYAYALGSLVAHELYHVLTNSIHHDPEGAGKSRHRPQDLLSQNLSFLNEVRKGHP